MSVITPYRILSVTRAENGWTALISVADTVLVATRVSGSWALIDGERRREILPHIAADLQDHVKKAERSQLRCRQP